MPVPLFYFIIGTFCGNGKVSNSQGAEKFLSTQLNRSVLKYSQKLCLFCSVRISPWSKIFLACIPALTTENDL